MSSPASAEWSVIENERLLRLAREQAWGEARTLEVQGRQLVEEVHAARAKYGSEFPAPDVRLPERPARSGDLPAVESYLAALQTRLGQIEQGLAQAIANQETRRLLAEMAKHAAGRAMSAKELFSGPKRQAQECQGGVAITSDGPMQAQRQSEVLRILSRISGAVPAAERKDLDGLAADVLSSSSAGRAETLTYELRLRVQRANEKAEAAFRDVEKAADLRRLLRGLDGAEVSAVVADLEKVERREQPLTAALVQRVEHLEKVARRHADRAYAADVIKEELRRLGYEVDEEFSTLMVEGGQILISKSGLKDYGIAMSVAPGEPQLGVELVRLRSKEDLATSEQKTRDKEMQETWCRDFAQMFAQLGKRKIMARVIQHSKPGTMAVPVIEQKEIEQQRRRRREKAALQRRI